MSLSARRTLVFVFILWAGTVAHADETATGQCSIQLTYLECYACCDTSTSLGDVLVPLCEAATRGSGAIIGGWFGSVVGGLAGDLICAPMMQNADCYSRCTGKDGDPSPIVCFDPGDPDELGVCRQICEQGQHNVGTAGCPIDVPFPLACCVNEYDPPDDECPDALCPGLLCPPECADALP